MRKLRILLPVISAGLLLFACKEEKHGIVFTVPEKPLLDTTYTISTVPAAQDHDVLIFDMTGVRCSNCPDAARIARKIADTLHPGRVTVVAMYIQSSAPLWWPWPGYDTLANADAEAISQSLGGISSLPIGCVDQIKVSGSRFLDRFSWASNVNNRLAVSTPLNIDLVTSWDNSKNRGRINAKVTYTQNVSNKNLVYIAVTESHIRGMQSNQDTVKGISYYYEHNHALRKLYTSTTGDTLKADLAAGRVFEKQYYVNPRYNWKSKNLDAVVWVVDATTKEVLQVAHAKLQP